MPWPISERGADMEETKAQMDAKDRLNFEQLQLAKKKSEKLIADKAKKK